MKSINLVIVLVAFCNIGCAQTNLEFAQGFWKGDTEGFQSYIVVEGNYWYSVTILDESIDVSKEWFGFYDNFDANSIHPKDLLSTGRYIVFLTYRKSIREYDTNLERGYFKIYEFDLDNDYLVYYGNDPVTLNKIESLPKDVSTYFLQEKKRLDRIKFLD